MLSSKKKTKDPHTIQDRFHFSRTHEGRISLILATVVLFAPVIVPVLFQSQPSVYWHVPSQSDSVKGIQKMFTKWVHLPLEHQAKAIARFSTVKHVFVKRLFPDRLDIYLELRTPFAIVQDTEGFKIVDDTGLFFQWYEGPVAGKRPYPFIQTDIRVASVFPQFWFIRTLVSALDSRENRAWFRQFNVYIIWSKQKLVIRVPNPNFYIIIGDDKDIELASLWYPEVQKRLKALRQQWNAILRMAQEKSYNEIDLRYHDQIVLRKRENE